MELINIIDNSNIAVIGGGRRCKMLLEAIFTDTYSEKHPKICGVADINPQAVGFLYAKEKGIFVTNDFSEFFSMQELDVLLDLTRNDHIAWMVKKSKPAWVLFIDRYEALSIVEYYQARAKKNEILVKIKEDKSNTHTIKDYVEAFYSYVLEINRDRNQIFKEMREKMIADEWTLSQIIHSSSIPMFMIDKTHSIIYWNRACEKLTGYSAKEMVGTDHQWKPFRSEKRPTLADLILDGVKEEDLWRYYGTKWEKSELIDGAYEVEEFFPHLGKNGTWLFFTAAPIKSPDGYLVGAIETFWDKTKEKRAEEERERQNKELAQKVKELEANEQIMSQIIQGSTIPTFVINENHVITHWNTALERLTGYSSKDMVGTTNQWTPFYDKPRPTMADVVLDQIDEVEISKLYGTKWRKSLLIDNAYEAEVFFPNIGEKGKWCWFTAAPIITPYNKIIGAIETIWDKTEDRKAEKERERHTKELATYCSIYATLSSSLSLEGRIKAAIEETSNIFSLDGICIFILKSDGKYHLRYSFGFSDRVNFYQKVVDEDSIISQIGKSGKITLYNELPESTNGEINLLRQEGWKSVVYIPIVDKSKKTFGVIRAASRIANHFDSDAIRSLELIGNRIGVAIENSSLQEEIRRRAGFQSKLIGSSNDGIIATDDQWKIVIYNPMAEAIFGYSASEVIGKVDARTIYPSDIAEIFSNMLMPESHVGTLPWQERTITSKTGELIPVRFSGTILREKNRMMGSVAFFHDLREIKRLEKELVTAERLAAVGQTVAGMAHCIKNILHGLSGGSYIVDIGISTNNPEKLKSGWDIVKRNIGRTSDLVQDLLSYSKEREPEYQNCFPNEIADEVTKLMEEVAKQNQIEIIQHFSSDIGEVMLDPRTVHRCLMNLVSNAIDACRLDPDTTKHHCVTISTFLEKDNFIRFEVQDNGCGMTDEVKQKLFTSFFSTKGAQGTGLGLLVTSKLIEEHKGKIEVTSQLGQGTTFSFRLPFKPVEKKSEEKG